MNTLFTIMKLLPLVLSAVKAIEEAIPLPNQGKKKLDLVLDVIQSAYDQSPDLTKSLSWPQLVSILTQMIGKIVGVHNELGLFDKPAQTKTA